MDRILVVDDNPKNIELLGNVLSENGYDVEYVLDGENALRFIESEDFDLILMDVMMPGMDGFEACKRIKQMNGKADIPLIFLTAMNDSDSISKGFEAGGVDYLIKPFNTNELLARVNTHISLKKSKDELSELNQSLEEKVKKRTEELAILNEKLINAYKELEVLDKSKNDFLQIINHEIRTPLNGIIGFSRIIKENIGNEVVVDMINFLDESCKRLEQFSYTALDISHLNLMGDKSMIFIDLDVSNEISSVINSLEKEFAVKKINVAFEAEKKILKVDKKYFAICINTILSNAIKHSPYKSKITVQGVVDNQVYQIYIKDEGKGFPEVLLQGGIKAFISVDHIDKNPGLELYLCKLIIENHNGTIHLMNHQGAQIDIEMPIY